MRGIMYHSDPEYNHRLMLIPDSKRGLYYQTEWYSISQPLQEQHPRFFFDKKPLELVGGIFSGVPDGVKFNVKVVDRSEIGITRGWPSGRNVIPIPPES